MCPDSWDLNDANVVCRQLGYDGAQSASDSKAFNSRTELMWMSNVRCKGNEILLSECSHNGWNESFCQSFTHASVVCIHPGIKLLKFSKLQLTVAKNYP